MLNNNGGSRTDTLIKLVLVFFLSLLSFSVGTFVGKQFSDSQHKIAELENPIAGEGERSMASIPADATKAEVGKAISDEEISKLSEEFVKKEKQEGTPAADETAKLAGHMVGEEKAGELEKKAEVKKMISVKDEIANVSKRIAKGETVEAPKKVKSRIPSSLPVELANSALGKFTVQVSSHPNEEEAKQEAQKLKDKGMSASYFKATINGKSWYRVCLGLFDNRKAAKEYRDKVIATGDLKSAIVQKIAGDSTGL